MGYCTVDDLRRVLPEKISIGDENIGTPVPGRSAMKRSNITPSEAEEYIEYAQQYIDSRLRPFYACPLRRVKLYEIELEANVSAGSNVDVVIRDTGAFTKGDLVRLQDASGMELTTVSSVSNLTAIVLTSVTGNYVASDNGRLSIVKFPDPIPVMTARMACSIMLDRLFSAEQAPDVSNYGVTQRNMATIALDSILSGQTLLFGQEHTGRRFIRGSLFDAYKSPAEISKGEEKE